MDINTRLEAVRAARSVVVPNEDINRLLVFATYIERYIETGRLPQERGDEVTYSRLQGGS